MGVALAASEKRDGRVFTPRTVADALCRWAIRGPTDVVLDLGVGEGAFLLAAVRRLQALGADANQVSNAIHGAELNTSAYERAQAQVREYLGLKLPHVLRGDFYTTPLPAADAAVGNPPYIRRHYQPDPDAHRASAGAVSADRMMDAYCYFLLRACASLVPGGRLAAIVSGSWLDMRYGAALKRLLSGDDFSIRLVLSFEGRVFPSALVKPVVLLAERTMDSTPVRFVRLGQGVDLARLSQVVDELIEGCAVPGVTGTDVPRRELKTESAWSMFLKAPSAYSALLACGTWVPLRTLAESRIGLQTFAKPFYLLTRDEAVRACIEPEYLLPLAFSPRRVHGPVLAHAHATPHVVFACDRPLHEIRESGAARHIARGMDAVVRVRGTDSAVQGYHRAPRLRRAGRDPWYNIRSEIARRGTWPILVPRRAFATFMVVHNLVGTVANEDFLEIRPREPALLEPLLAVLNTSFGEFVIRSHAFQYGGGVFNLNPGALRNLPVPDIAHLPPPRRGELTEAWRAFAAGDGSASARLALDDRVAGVLSLPRQVRADVSQALAAFVRSARASVVPQGMEQLELADVE
jgi:hypothetical protein